MTCRSDGSSRLAGRVPLLLLPLARRQTLKLDAKRTGNMSKTFTLVLNEQEAAAMTEAWGVISALACAEPLLATLFFERFLQQDKTLTEKVTKLLHDVAVEQGIKLPNFGAKMQQDEQATRDSWAGSLGEQEAE